MPNIVIGLFEQSPRAEDAIRELENAEFDRSRITLISGNGHGKYAQHVGQETSGVLLGPTAEERVSRGGALLLVGAEHHETEAVEHIVHRTGGSISDLPMVDTFEVEFHRDFCARYKRNGYTYKQFAPAYHYGHQLTRNHQYRGKAWTAVESGVCREWQHDNPDTWEQVKDAIRHAFLIGGQEK